MPRRNWPHRLAKKRKKHRAHRMKRRTPAQRQGRGDEPTQEQNRKQTTEAEAPPQGRKQVEEGE